MFSLGNGIYTWPFYSVPLLQSVCVRDSTSSNNWLIILQWWGSQLELRASGSSYSPTFRSLKWSSLSVRPCVDTSIVKHSYCSSRASICVCCGLSHHRIIGEPSGELFLVQIKSPSSLCYLQRHHRTGFQKTDSHIDRIIRCESTLPPSVRALTIGLQ